MKKISSTSLTPDILDELNLSTENSKFNYNVSAASKTTFKLGANIHVLIESSSCKDLKKILSCFYNNSVKPRILGYGSNIVMPDESICSPIIIFTPDSCKIFPLYENIEKDFVPDDFTGDKGIKNLDSFKTFLSDLPDSSHKGERFYFRVHSGASLMSASRIMSAAGFSGLEFAAGIPGSFGGAVRMNAGAHGNEISTIIHKVHTLDSSGLLITYCRNDLNFTYRKVNIPYDSIVIAVDIVLEYEDKEIVSQNRLSALEYRKKTQPLRYPSAGSVFRNPVNSEFSAGYLLESVGLKGFAQGGVKYSDLHANWIINYSDNPCADDVKKLVDIGKQKILKEYGLEMNTEIIFWDAD